LFSQRAYTSRPPSVGWWPTGYHTLRWWDGKHWSWTCFDSDNLKQVTKYADKHEDKHMIVHWYHRPKHWPERSKT